jgi:outer membrane lipoprotein SlyB
MNMRLDVALTETLRRLASASALGVMLLLAGCGTTPSYQVIQEPVPRVGTVDSVTQEVVQEVPNAVGAIGGAIVGGGLGSLIGSGSGQTVATVVGAIGGGFVGNEAARRTQRVVWRVGVRYDDGSIASIQQTSPPNLRVGDRVRITQQGIERLH